MSATGSMYGLAFGDSLGKPTEFMRFTEIVAKYGPEGPSDLPDGGLVTDDTQMALAVAEALLALPSAAPLSAAVLAPELVQRYQAWAISPENNRAPGMTCLRAIGNLDGGRPWVDATIPGSKGCDANMRVTPIGLVP